MNDLASEMWAAWKGMTPLVFERLNALGVTRPAIAASLSQTSPHAPVGLMRIEVSSNGLWQPFDHGRPALVQPVTVRGDWGCDVIDLVAWRSGDPLSFYCRTGNAWALGVDHIDRVMSAWEPEALRVYPTPLDWLAAGGDGLVVLDWSSAELAELRLLGAIDVPNRKFGGVLRDALLRAPRLPTIRTRSEGVRLAA